MGKNKNNSDHSESPTSKKFKSPPRQELFKLPSTSSTNIVNLMKNIAPINTADEPKRKSSPLTSQTKCLNREQDIAEALPKTKLTQKHLVIQSDNVHLQQSEDEAPKPCPTREHSQKRPTIRKPRTLHQKSQNIKTKLKKTVGSSSYSSSSKPLVDKDTSLEDTDIDSAAPEVEKEDQDFVSLREDLNTLSQNVNTLTKLVYDMAQQNNFRDAGSSVALDQSSAPPEGELHLPLRHANTLCTPSFTSGLPAGETLPDRIKNLIWQNKYVDFFMILYPDTDSNYTLLLNNSDSTPTLDLAPRKRRPLTEREWILAFDDFLAIYVRKFPNEIQDLLSYGKFIKELMTKNFNWSYYDHKFRKDREYNLCKWTTIRIDLQIAASHKTNLVEKEKFRQPGLPQQNYQIPVGFCFNFHSKDKRCSVSYCKWKHICARCFSKHPMYTTCSNSNSYDSYHKFKEHNNVPYRRQTANYRNKQQANSQITNSY